MKNRLVFLFIALLLAAAVLFCYTSFEITGSPRWISPSREARENPYLALERWLAGQGRPSRVLSAGDIDTVLAGTASTVFIESSVFRWPGDDAETRSGHDSEEADGADNADASSRAYTPLNSWVREGGSLVISIDTGSAGWKLARYLKSLGIAEYKEPDTESIDNDENDDAETADGAAEPDSDAVLFDYDSYPRIDRYKNFVVTKSGEVDNVKIINNIEYVSPGKAKMLPGHISFVYLEMGKGSISVTGKCRFLFNNALREKANANLAGALFLDREGGVLFIRENRNEKHLFGSLAERGNPLPLGIAALVLAVTGFWMVIPLFGRNKPVPVRPGKPLRERFLAEGRFLFRYNALDKYLSVYETELEQRRRLCGIEKEDKTKKGKKKRSLRNFMQKQLDYMEELDKLYSFNFTLYNSFAVFQAKALQNREKEFPGEKRWLRNTLLSLRRRP